MLGNSVTVNTKTSAVIRKREESSRIESVWSACECSAPGQSPTGPLVWADVSISSQSVCSAHVCVDRALRMCEATEAIFDYAFGGVGAR